MSILRGTSNPPTASIGSVSYNGNAQTEYVDKTELAAGTYYYAFQATSDTEDVGDKSTAQAIVVTGAPVAPEGIDYTSGNAAATVISFTGSTTPTATYNIYIQNPDDEFLDTSTPAMTRPAGSTTATLPAVTGYPGTVKVLVRALLGGVEELNGQVFLIEYDASGVYVAQRPNTAQIATVGVTSGLTLNVRGVYDSTDEVGTATQLQLFTRTPTTAYNFATIADSTALSGNMDGIKRATLNKTLTVDGWYYVTIKAATASGHQSLQESPEVLVYVSDENITAPTGTFTLSRG